MCVHHPLAVPTSTSALSSCLLCLLQTEDHPVSADEPLEELFSPSAASQFAHLEKQVLLANF